MIILHMSGGLGNQMFQYAFGRAQANRLGVELKLELSDPTLFIHNGFELKRLFNIQEEVATWDEIHPIMSLQRFTVIRRLINIPGLQKLLNKSIIREPHFHYSPQMLKLKDNSYLHGYWQSEKYFAEIADDVLSQYSFKPPPSRHNLDISNKIASLNSVSLHVRRNDFAKNAKINSIHGLCSLDYYKAAIILVSEKLKNPHFFIFSDDSKWIKSSLHLDQPCDYITHNQGQDSFNDMRLMSQCKHNIIANSSFSWWGAWLNKNEQKIVVAPRKWFNSTAINTCDLIPQQWISL